MIVGSKSRMTISLTRTAVRNVSIAALRPRYTCVYRTPVVTPVGMLPTGQMASHGYHAVLPHRVEACHRIFDAIISLDSLINLRCHGLDRMNCYQ